MANLKNINLMSQGTFESIEQADDELYAVSASGIGFPSSRYEDLTLGASGTQYTAPANGYFIVVGNTNTVGGSIELHNDLNGMYVLSRHYNTSNWDLGASIPVLKGDVIRIRYALSSVSIFRFIYAEGE